MFYQILLFEFENFGQIELEDAIPLLDLALMGLESDKSGWTPEDGPKEDLADRIVTILCDKSEILRVYYGLIIDKDSKSLSALPLLVGKYLLNLKIEYQKT